MNKDIPKLQYKHTKTSDTKGFNIQTLGNFHERKLDFSPTLLYSFHQIEFFAILIITDGEVKHTVDFKKVHLKKGDSLIVTKGQVHSFDIESTYEGFLLMFSEEFLHKYFAQATINKIRFLYESHRNNLLFSNTSVNRFLIQSINEQLSQNTNIHANQIGALLSFYLLHFVNEEPEVYSDNHFYTTFTSFNKLIAKEYKSTRNAKDYAKALHISYKHLNDICKHMTNKTAKALIDDYIILKAKRQLVTSSLTIKEIGFNLGFNESSNFRKYFCKHVSVSPNQFLKKLKLVTH